MDSSDIQGAPLTAAQTGLWFAHMVRPDTHEYDLVFLLHIAGAVEVALFEKAVRAAESESGAFGVSFSEVGGVARQRWVGRESSFVVADVTGAPDVRVEMDSFLAVRWKTAFDLLADAPLCDNVLFLTGPDQSVWCRRFHHILSDGHGEVLLQHRVAEIYGGLVGERHSGGTPLGHVSHLVAADVEYRSSAAYLGDRDYWLSALAGAPPQARLGHARHDSPDAEPRTHLHQARIGQREAVALRELGRGWAPVVAAVAHFVASSMGTQQMTLGFPMANREGRVAASTPGMVANELPLGLSFRPGATAGDMVLHAADRMAQLVAHQAYPSLDLRREIGLVGSDDAFGGVAVNILGFHRDPEFGGLRSRLETLNYGPADDLVVHVRVAQGRELILDLQANAHLHNEESLAATGERLKTLVEGFARADPHRIPPVTTPGERSLVDGWSSRPAASASAPLDELFARQAVATPDATAVVMGDTRLSFAELNNRVSRLAHRLASLGAGPEKSVGVAVTRSVESVVSVLAVLRAGSAYLPLDPGQPQARTVRVLAQVPAVAAVLVNDAHGEALAASAGLLVVSAVDSDPDRPGGLAPNSLARPSPQSLAYVIATSGSTGEPKVVGVEHRSLANMYASHRRRVYDIEARRHPNRQLRVALTYGFNFDGFWSPMFWMVSGHELHILNDSDRRDPEELLRRAGKESIDVLETTPSFAALLLDSGVGSTSDAPKVLILGGEEIKPGLWHRLSGLGAAVYNVYGPTEATIDPVSCAVSEHRQPSIGRPADNNRAYVLDASLRPVAPGVVGELYLGGTGLARGYVSRPALTSERFVADPFAGPGERMYRTGDLVAWDDEGALAFVSRADDQVKIRGFRVEPAEIEAAIGEIDGVRQVVATVRSDASGHPKIVAYIVADNEAPKPVTLRELTTSRLPEWLVPAAFVVLDSIPLTTNGKVDRAALPEPHTTDDEGGAPRSETETILADLFCEVLGVERVGLATNFFRLGGDSLAAARLAARVRAVCGSTVGIRDVFEAPTIETLASRLTSRPAAAQAPIARRSSGVAAPLTPGQRRMWLTSQWNRHETAYNVPTVWRLRGQVNRVALGEALADVAERHEPLRTVFPDTDGVPRVRILPRPSVASILSVVEAGDETALDAAVTTARTHPFDLRDEIPFRASLVVRSDDESTLVITTHHIATDGWSAAPFADDLEFAYRSRLNGTEPGWEPLPVTYSDFSHWREDAMGDESEEDSVVARQARYWARTLENLPAQIGLPYDRPRGVEANLVGGSHRSRVHAGLHRQIRELARSSDVTVFMVLHATLVTLLSKLGAGRDIPVGTVTGGRAAPELERLVGFFVNTIVLRVEVSGELTFRQLLRRVREADLGGFANDDLPFDAVVDLLRPERSAALHPLFQTLLVLEDGAEPLPSLPGLEVVAAPAATPSAKFDLTFTVTQRSDATHAPAGLDIELGYTSSLFDSATAADIAGRYLRLLETVTAYPDLPLGRLPLTSEAERESFIGTAVRADEPVCVHEAFERQVRATPHAVALVHGVQRLSYTDLNQKANRLARRLLEEGVQGGAVVGVYLERGIDSMASLLAVLKAGAAYTMLDVEHPVERTSVVILACRATVVVTDRQDLGARIAGLTIVDPREPDSATTEDLGLVCSPAAAASVMFTSGSTGDPKGVVTPHRAITGTYLGQAYAPFDGSQVWLQNSPMTWDAFALELFGALLFGGQVVLYPDATPNLDDLEALVREHGVTVLQMSASLFNLVVDERPGTLAGVDRVITAGEPASASHVRRAVAMFPRLTVVNGYGPVESMGLSTHHDVADVGDVSDVVDGSRVPIGRPVAGKRAYVLDADLNLVPVGAPGELYLAGVGLADGYVGRPGLTAERFVACPFGAPGERMYRTGDLVRWDRRGRLVFLGRTDFQVKVRGFRVEPGEVEASLLDAPGVRQAVVLLREDTPGVRRLVAYLVGEVAGSAVREFVAGRLPDYLLPSAFVVLPGLPLTATGKLDRRALPAPVFETRPSGGRPGTERERVLCGLYEELLGVGPVGVDDGFFALGGDSIRSIQLIARARRAGLGLTPRDVFVHQTVAALAYAATDLEEPGGEPPSPQHELTPLVLDEGEALLDFRPRRSE